MAAKGTFPSCFTFLKEALLLPTRNLKLFTPVLLLLAVNSSLVSLINLLFVQPLAPDMARHAAELKNADPSSAEILEEAGRESQGVMVLLAANAALLLVALPLDFANQILPFYAASTTYSGRRYSLVGLLRALAAKGGALSIKGPSVTIAVAAALELSCAALLGAPLYAMTGPGSSSRSGVISAMQGLLFVLLSVAYLCLNVVKLVGVAASVADGGACRGVHALRRAWRLMTAVRRKEGLVLVLAAHLLPALLTPLYAKKKMATGLFLQSWYALLSCAFQIFSAAAATVYYRQSMESKEGILLVFTSRFLLGKQMCGRNLRSLSSS